MRKLSLKRFVASVCLGVVLALMLLVPAGTAAGETFQQGDLVVATQTGFKWLRADGTFVKSLPIGFTNQDGPLFWRAAFNPSGTQMWATTGTDSSDNKVIAYDNQGNLLGAVIDSFDPERGCGTPADISFDAAGFAYIGDVDGLRRRCEEVHVRGGLRGHRHSGRDRLGRHRRGPVQRR